MPKKKKKTKVRWAKKIKKTVRKAAKKSKSTAKRKKSKVSKKPKAKPQKPARPRENVVGVVTHYFPHVKAAVVKVKKPLAVNDPITIKGHTTNFEQRVTSMQIDHVPIQSAKAGDEIGLEVVDRTREGDRIVKGK